MIRKSWKNNISKIKKRPKPVTDPGGGGIIPSPAPVDGITYNYPAGSFLISFPFRAWPEEDLGLHVSNSDPSDGVGFPLEEGVWSVEEFVSMLAPGGQIKKITGVHPIQNQGVATQKVNGVWVGSLTHIYPQMAYWVEFDSPINQRVNAPYGMINSDYKMVIHAGPNYRAYPYPDKPEYRDIEPSDTSVVSNTIVDGTITKELIGTGTASNYSNITGQGSTWVGSFKFNPGQGFILQTSEGMDYYWQEGCGNNWQHMDLHCPSLFNQWPSFREGGKVSNKYSNKYKSKQIEQVNHKNIGKVPVLSENPPPGFNPTREECNRPGWLANCCPQGWNLPWHYNYGSNCTSSYPDPVNVNCYVAMESSDCPNYMHYNLTKIQCDERSGGVSPNGMNMHGWCTSCDNFYIDYYDPNSWPDESTQVCPTGWITCPPMLNSDSCDICHCNTYFQGYTETCIPTGSCDTWTTPNRYPIAYCNASGCGAEQAFPNYCGNNYHGACTTNWNDCLFPPSVANLNGTCDPCEHDPDIPGGPDCNHGYCSGNCVCPDDNQYGSWGIYPNCVLPTPPPAEEPRDYTWQGGQKRAGGTTGQGNFIRRKPNPTKSKMSIRPKQSIPKKIKPTTSKPKWCHCQCQFTPNPDAPLSGWMDMFSAYASYDAYTMSAPENPYPEYFEDTCTRDTECFNVCNETCLYHYKNPENSGPNPPWQLHSYKCDYSDGAWYYQDCQTVAWSDCFRDGLPPFNG